MQTCIHHLSPSGIAGFVFANCSMSSNTSDEGEIRKNIIEKDLLDCIIALPGQLFYNTAIPACLWFLARDKQDSGFRDRRGEKVESGRYEDIPGFCKAVTLGEIKKHDYILTPGSHVGFEETENNDKEFEDKMERLTAELSEHFRKSKELERKIKENLAGLGMKFNSS